MSSLKSAPNQCERISQRAAPTPFPRGSIKRLGENAKTAASIFLGFDKHYTKQKGESLGYELNKKAAKVK